MEGNVYLAVAMIDSGNADSVILRWNGSRFVAFQSIATHGAYDWEWFSIGGDAFLAVANHQSGGSSDVDSVVYKWSRTTNGFEMYQRIGTHGAEHIEWFNINGQDFLAIANFYSSDSVIYQWQNSLFVPFQTVSNPAHAASWKWFALGRANYLALAYHHDSTEYNIASRIFQWNGTLFVPVQSVATQGAENWEWFSINGTNFLAVANSQDNGNYNVDSVVYQLSACS
eukprot:m.168483 g.168483  ORF g.168483 m.168483 type:complete len:227 (-) comp21164_c0_seq1:59-739(-)